MDRDPGFSDIIYEKCDEGIAKITINRPEVRNAFRPETVKELQTAFDDAREDAGIGVIILTGQGKEAFCSGGDQRVRGDGGYVGDDGVPRLNVLDLQRQIRTLPEAGDRDGRRLRDRRRPRAAHDLRPDDRRRQRALRPDRPEGRQLRRRLRRVVHGAHRRPEEGARDLVPVPAVRRAAGAGDGAGQRGRAATSELEAETVSWCREILANSPIALRCLKAALNADCDGQAGLQELAGNATLLFYLTEEGQEGRNAYVEKRKPDFRKFPRLP